MDFKELVSPSLTDMFVHEIERMILSNELKKGERLPTERELAIQMKVSTAVVNGGIKRLADRGFVTILPRKGVVVADYIREGNIDTLKSILEYNKDYYQENILESLVDFRRSYEVKVTEEACLNRKEENLVNLDHLLSKMKNETDVDALSELAYLFHHEIAIASGGVVRALLIATFKIGYTSSYRSMLKLGNFREEYLAFFTELNQAIKNKDSQSAASFVLSSINRWEEANKSIQNKKKA
jgi:GntR family transcriptional repressor for pyruvate dehydrogenase complex